MEFEDSPAVTDKDRAQADAPRVNLQPIHGDVELKESPQFSRFSQAQGQGRAFSFETETTETAAKEANGQHGGAHHHLALITAGLVCAPFVTGVIVVQLNR